MATTSPDNIPYPDSAFVGGFKLAMSTAIGRIQELFTDRRRRSYSWATQTQRDAQTGMSIDDMGYQVDTDSSYRYSGSSWILWNMARRQFTPTVVAGTVGNGSLANSMYQVVEGRVFGRIAFVLGTTSNPANLTFQAPVAIPAAQGTNSPIGQVVMFDASSGQRYSAPVVVQGQNIQPFRVSTSAQNVVGPITATAPFVWASTDRILLEFNYPLA